MGLLEAFSGVCGLVFRLYGLGFRKNFWCLTFQHKIKAFRDVLGFGVWGLVFRF